MNSRHRPTGWCRGCICLAASRAMILLCYDVPRTPAAISKAGELLGGQPMTSRLFNNSTVAQKERRRAATDPPSAMTILLRVENAAHAQRPR